MLEYWIKDQIPNSQHIKNIYKETQKLWSENLKRLEKVSLINYIMFCEAPPYCKVGGVKNYIYNPEGTSNGLYLKAPYRAFVNDVKEFPSKDKMIEKLNKEGFLMIDILPLAINYSSIRASEQYREFLYKCWSSTANKDSHFEFCIQNRIKKIESKISDDVKLGFSMKSLRNNLLSYNCSVIEIAKKKYTIEKDFVDLSNSSGYPSSEKISRSFIPTVTQ